MILKLKTFFSDAGLAIFLAFLAMFSHPKPGVAGAVRPRQLKCCGIVGAGLMGGGIAMCCAEAGMKVGIGCQNARNMARVSLQNTHMTLKMVVCNRNLLCSSDLFSGAVLVSKMDVDGRMLVHPREIPEQNDSLGWQISWLQTTPTLMASPTCTVCICFVFLLRPHGPKNDKSQENKSPTFVVSDWLAIFQGFVPRKEVCNWFLSREVWQVIE